MATLNERLNKHLSKVYEESADMDKQLRAICKKHGGENNLGNILWAMDYALEEKEDRITIERLDSTGDKALYTIVREILVSHLEKRDTDAKLIAPALKALENAYKKAEPAIKKQMGQAAYEDTLEDFDQEEIEAEAKRQGVKVLDLVFPNSDDDLDYCSELIDTPTDLGAVAKKFGKGSAVSLITSAVSSGAMGRVAKLPMFFF